MTITDKAPSARAGAAPAEPVAVPTLAMQEPIQPASDGLWTEAGQPELATRLGDSWLPG